MLYSIKNESEYVKKLFIGLFIICSIMISLLIHQYQKIAIGEQLQNTTDKYTRAFHTVYDHKKEISKILFTGLANVGGINQKLYQIMQTPKQKDIVRQKLLQDLKQRYAKLHTMGLRQVHIFLPNNESFLRLHRPKMFGDSLTSIRYTVEYVNKTHLPIDTFEDGRTYYGFRFVYPLFYNKTYVGCMETSFGAASITSSLMNEYYVLSNFFIKKSTADAKLFDISKSIYIQSSHKDFYFDKEVLEEIQKVSRKDLKDLIPSKKTLHKIRDIALGGVTHSLYDSNINAIFTIIPIYNKLINQNVAFLSIRSKSDSIITSRVYIYTINILLIGVLGLSLFILYSLLSQKAILKTEVTQKTQSLNEINATLEQKIEEKTQELTNNYKKLSKLSIKIEEEKYKYKKILELASDSIFILKLDGSLYEYSKKTSTTLGYTKEEMTELNIYDWNPCISEQDFKEYIQNLKLGIFSIETKHRRKDGSIFDVQITSNLINIDNEQYIYSSARDISKEKKLEKQLLKERDFAFSIINNSTMVLLTTGVHIEFANQAFLEFFNCEDLELFRQTYISIAYHFIHNDTYFHLGKIQDKKRWIEALIDLPEEQRIISLISQKTYEPKAFHVSITKYDDTNYLLNFTDISERMIRQIDLENKVNHDQLTNAYNREYFHRNIESIIAHNKNSGKKTGLALLDIDYFKSINDTYGHDVGDNVLKLLVKLIKKNLRDTDILIRWGGEEFILVLNIDNKTLLSKVLENCRELIEQTSLLESRKITCSFGATLYEKDERIEETIKRADIALYDAKRNGRNQVITL